MRRIDSDLLCMAACTLLIVICGAFVEAMFGDWTAAWKDCAFGGVVLAAFAIVQWMYANSQIGVSRAAAPTVEPCAEILSRKECFAANVLTIANPLADPHDFASIPMYETERIIASGRYRLELVKSRNGEPTLVVCED